jgi:hypothetical protein
MEIARENGISSEEAVKRFLSDVELQYNNILGFQSKIDSLRSEVNRLRVELFSLPQVAPKLLKLSQNGVSEQAIINIAAVFEKYVTDKDRESFVSDLEAHGGLKSAIQELSKQADKRRTEVDSLQTQNSDLNADNQRIVSNLVNSRYTLDFMQGYINSLRNEILGLVSISVHITCSMGLQFKCLEKLKSSNGDEFASPAIRSNLSLIPPDSDQRTSFRINYSIYTENSVCVIARRCIMAVPLTTTVTPKIR